MRVKPDTITPAQGRGQILRVKPDTITPAQGRGQIHGLILKSFPVQRSAFARRRTRTQPSHTGWQFPLFSHMTRRRSQAGVPSRDAGKERWAPEPVLERDAIVPCVAPGLPPHPPRQLQTTDHLLILRSTAVSQSPASLEG